MTTKHDHPPSFGRRIDGCPRCDELKAGSAPVSWTRSRKLDAGRAAEIRDHDCKTARCAIVCTFADW